MGAILPLLWLSLIFLAGITLAAGWSLSPAVFAAAGLGAALAAAAEARFARRWERYAALRRTLPLPVFALLAAFLAGAFAARLAVPIPTEKRIEYYNDHGQVRVEGWVCAAPQRKTTAMHIHLCAEKVRIEGEWRPVSGGVLVLTPLGSHWRYGDRLQADGDLSTPPILETFDYRAYLARQGIGARMAYPYLKSLPGQSGSALLRGLERLRRQANELLFTLYPQPEASLMAGILLGLEDEIPPNVQDAFRRTGTSHIIAISGFNITILASLLTWFAVRLIRRVWAPLLAAGLIAVYTLLVGADPPVVRAAIMGTVALLGGVLGRRGSGLTSLAFSAAVMALFHPPIVSEICFQLSFAASGGLALLADPLARQLARWIKRLPEGWLRSAAAVAGESLLITLVAQLATLPVIAGNFGRISLSALLSNPLILPPQPAVMVLGGVSLLAAFIALPLGKLMAALVWPLPAYTIRAAEWLARLPGGEIQLQFSLTAALVFYALLLWFAWRGKDRLESWRAWLPNAALTALALAAVGIWHLALDRPDGTLHLTLPAQGGLAVLTSPAGQTVVLGGGDDGRTLTDTVHRALPAGARGVDLYLPCAAAARPLRGSVEMVQATAIQQAIWSEPADPTAAARDLTAALRAGEIPFAPALAGTRFAFEQLELSLQPAKDPARLVQIDSAGVRIWLGCANAQPPAGLTPGAVVVLLSADPETLSVWQAAAPAVLIAPGAGYDPAAAGGLELTAAKGQIWLDSLSR